MRSRYRCFPVALRKPEILFILLPSMVDRYNEIYGPADFEYCLLAALLGPNWSSLAIERVGLSLGEKNKRPRKGPLIFLAERVGFEPTVRGYRTPDFESGSFDHSDTSPCWVTRVVTRDIGKLCLACQVRKMLRAKSRPHHLYAVVRRQWVTRSRPCSQSVGPAPVSAADNTAGTRRETEHGQACRA
jgi:hypothetical protein